MGLSLLSGLQAAASAEKNSEHVKINAADIKVLEMIDKIAACDLTAKLLYVSQSIVVIYCEEAIKDTGDICWLVLMFLRKVIRSEISVAAANMFETLLTEETSEVRVKIYSFLCETVQPCHIKASPAVNRLYRCVSIRMKVDLSLFSNCG